MIKNFIIKMYFIYFSINEKYEQRLIAIQFKVLECIEEFLIELPEYLFKIFDFLIYKLPDYIVIVEKKPKFVDDFEKKIDKMLEILYKNKVFIFLDRLWYKFNKEAEDRFLNEFPWWEWVAKERAKVPIEDKIYAWLKKRWKNRKIFKKKEV